MSVLWGFALVSLAGGVLLADGGPGPGGGTNGSGSTSALQVSLHVPNEMAPPGGLVQMKFMVTTPTPISTGEPLASFDTTVFDGVWGIELFSPGGDVNGVARVSGSKIALAYTTTSGTQGTDYPIMTMALHVRPNTLPGSQTLFQLDPSSTWTLGALGTAALNPTTPGTVTVGGSISILNVVPGGGLIPSGSIVSIRGIGFQPNTQVKLNAIKFSSIRYISSNEIQFTLAADTQMSGQKIQLVNPDGSQDTYFSYLRGIPLAQSSQPLLQNAVPVFSSVRHSWAEFAPIAPSPSNQIAGVAMQNDNVMPVVITAVLYSADQRVLGSSSFVLPSGYRLMAETSEIAQGVAPAPGSYLVVAATLPIEVFGFLGDNAAGTIVPFTAALAQP